MRGRAHLALRAFEPRPQQGPLEETNKWKKAPVHLARPHVNKPINATAVLDADICTLRAGTATSGVPDTPGIIQLHALKCA